MFTQASVPSEKDQVSPSLSSAAYHSKPFFPDRASYRLQDAKSIHTIVGSSLPDSRRVLTQYRPQLMLVDDDAVLLAALGSILDSLGFEVLPFNHPGDALASFQQSKGVDILLTDLQMPSLTGVELATLCTKWKPSLPILIHSGGEPSAQEWSDIHSYGWTFRRKPVPVPELAISLSSMLPFGKTLQR